jgi:hypothetical protein
MLMLSLLLWHNVAFSDTVSSSMLKIERFSAERGDVQSQYFMGEHYELGDSGLPRDLNAALKWYYKAADKGHATAQYKIGLFHEKGYAGLGGGMAAAKPWYEKAAAAGNAAAKSKLSDSNEAGRKSAPKRQKSDKVNRQKKERSRMLRADKPAMAGLPVKVAQKQLKKARQPTEIINTLMTSKWFHEGRPAEYLPTDDMNCLRTSDSEVTCFSGMRERIVGENRMEFTVKSVIGGFDGDGDFKTRYFYNVEEIGDAPTPGPDTDRYGLRSEKGWQQSGYEVVCHVKGTNSVVCRGKGRDIVRFDSQ